MAKQGAKTVTPRLRFPEFRAKRGWYSASLGTLFSERQDTGFNDLPLLSLMDKEGIIPQEESNRKNNSNSDKSKYLRVLPGDIAYNTMRMWEGRSAYAGIEGVISPAYTVCAPLEKTNSRFFSYYFKTEPLIGQFRKYSQGLVKDTLNLKYENFSRIQISYPSDENEQQKIADCLTSLEEVIAVQRHKLEALKAHKRGLMQQLFPREGETRPRLRFPEFRNAPDWSEERLGNLVDIRSGNSPSHYQLSKMGTYPFVKVEDLNNCVKYQSEAREYSDDTDGVIPTSSLIFPKRGAAIELNKIRLNEREILMDTNMMALTPYGELRAEFLFYCISHIGLSQIADSSTIPQINNKHIIPFKAVVPLPDEQRRIADCLSSLDTQITAESHQLAALKTHKQGLMQQLFPAPEAVHA